MRDNFGIVSLGDNATNVQVTYGDLRAEMEQPTTLPAARQAMFGPDRRPGLGSSVVRWLAPDAGIAPLQPREDTDDLTAWALDAPQSLVRLVTGAGGQGKTVLGAWSGTAWSGPGTLPGSSGFPARTGAPPTSPPRSRYTSSNG